MGSRIAFLNLDGVNVTPYFQYYRDLISESYDYIYWGRSDCGSEPDASNVYRYDSPVDSGASRYLQLLHGYLGFRRYASKLLSKHRYQRVVALTGNTATLLEPVLCRCYKGRYIIDIRDYFLENNPIYRAVEERVIENSGLAIISSPAYTNFLGDHDFVVMHNSQHISSRERAEVQNRVRPGDPFVLLSVGTCKNPENDKAVIRYFANDSRFLLRFIGRGYGVLESFIIDCGISNVELIDEFPSEMTLDFYKQADAVLSMYGSEKTHFKYQLTNKLYYSAQLELPIIVSPDTYMAETVDRYGLGIVLDFADTSQKDNILHLYDSDCRMAMVDGTRRFMSMASEQNAKALDAVKSFLSI